MVDVKGVQKAAADGVRIVDVRSVGEFEGGHIPGAQNVPLDQFQSVASQWDKNAPVLVYCQTGSRSAEAVIDARAARLHEDPALRQGNRRLDRRARAGRRLVCSAEHRVGQADAPRR